MNDTGATYDISCTVTTLVWTTQQRQWQEMINLGATHERTSAACERCIHGIGATHERHQLRFALNSKQDRLSLQRGCTARKLPFNVGA